MDRPAMSFLCSPTKKKHLPCHECHRSPPEQIGRKAPCSEIESKLCGAEWEGAAAKCLWIIYYVCTVHRWNLLLCYSSAHGFWGRFGFRVFDTPPHGHTHTHVRGYHTEATTDHLEGVWKALSLGAAKRAALNAFSTIRNCFLFVVLFSLDDVRCCSSLIWLKTTFGFDVVIVAVRGGAAAWVLLCYSHGMFDLASIFSFSVC